MATFKVAATAISSARKTVAVSGSRAVSKSRSIRALVSQRQSVIPKKFIAAAKKERAKSLVFSKLSAGQKVAKSVFLSQSAYQIQRKILEDQLNKSRDSRKAATNTSLELAKEALKKASEERVALQQTQKPLTTKALLPALPTIEDVASGIFNLVESTGDTTSGLVIGFFNAMKDLVWKPTIAWLQPINENLPEQKTLFKKSGADTYVIQIPEAYEYVNAQGVPSTDARDLDVNPVFALAGTISGAMGMGHAIWQPRITAVQQHEWFRYPSQMPNAQDLVRFQLREVFDPLLRQELLTPYPALDFVNHMQYLGFNRYWAESYWAAHWQLPAVGQAFEMFQRLRPEKNLDRAFNRDDLKRLLTRLDILPAYHEQLIDIAYQPITRIDVRRMYKLGFFKTVEDLSAAYQDIGYSPDDSFKLAEFTKADVDDDDVTSIRSLLMSAYEADDIDLDTIEELIAPTFRDRKIFDLWLLLINKKKERKSVGALNKSASAKAAIPSRSNIETWFKNALISEQQARDYLVQLRFSAQDIDLFLREWTAEITGS